MFVLSGSPTQMRAVIEQKLALDGVIVHRLILKDNLRNLRKGRLRALRGQIGYKLPTLLQERASGPAAVRETLFGDDCESDALIYVAYAEAIAGRLPWEGLRALLLAGGAYPDQLERAEAALASIRLDKRSPPSRFHVLGGRVSLVHHWLQAGMVLARDGRLSPAALGVLVEEVTAEGGVDAVVGLLQDGVVRGLFTGAQARALLAAFPALNDSWPGLLAMESAPREPVATPDYDAFLRSVQTLSIRRPR